MASRTDRDADALVRNKVKSIRESIEDTSSIETSSVQYLNISGEASTPITLKNAKYISIANTHNTLDTYVTISVARDDDAADIDSYSVHIIYKILLPIGTTLIFEENELKVELNSTLAIKLDVDAGTPTVSVIIKG